jgi:hypothetical protein
MEKVLIEIDSWVMALVLAAAMLVAWRIGWGKGQRLTQQGRPAPSSKFNDATLALLGLLLAFSFSLALGKHDQRRQMVVTDSNSIGDFYTCASLVKPPVQQELQQLIREYVEYRLALVKTGPNEASLRKIHEMHDHMQALVGKAVDAQTPVVVPLVNTLNEVTSSHTARLAASRDRLPASIVAVLFLAAVVAMVLLGMQQGASGDWHLTGMIGFVVLVSMVIWVTLDLNQPHRGLIRVSQEPLQQLLSGMGR